MGLTTFLIVTATVIENSLSSSSSNFIYTGWPIISAIKVYWRNITWFHMNHIVEPLLFSHFASVSKRVKCEAFHKDISFIHAQILVHLHVNKTNFHMKGFALGLALKQR